MTRSMTGFSRKDHSAPWGELAVELRAVNHRYLEMSMRLPEELRSLDPVIRGLVGKKLSRGKIDLSVKLNMTRSSEDNINLNEDLVDQLVSTVNKLGDKLGGGTLRPMDVLRWPGVVLEPVKDVESIQAQALSLITEALSSLVTSREGEGDRLEQMLLERTTAITGLVKATRERLPLIRKNIQDKLRARLNDLDVKADEGRLEAEIALLLNKADVDEELDRLDSHLVEIRDTFSDNKPVGRKLDFLMQELNREANTLASKSNDAETTQAAVDLKVFIEQMREQIQNIE